MGCYLWYTLDSGKNKHHWFLFGKVFNMLKNRVLGLKGIYRTSSSKLTFHRWGNWVPITYYLNSVGKLGPPVISLLYRDLPRMHLCWVTSACSVLVFLSLSPNPWQLPSWLSRAIHGGFKVVTWKLISFFLFILKTAQSVIGHRFSFSPLSDCYFKQNSTFWLESWTRDLAVVWGRCRDPYQHTETRSWWDFVNCLGEWCWDSGWRWRPKEDEYTVHRQGFHHLHAT